MFNVDEVAEGLRQKPYHLFRSDCLTKSIRLVKECKKHNINAKLDKMYARINIYFCLNIIFLNPLMSFFELISE